MSSCRAQALVLAAIAAASVPTSAQSPTWRYYRPGNTGIQGDYCEAIWVDHDGDPWIGGYQPSFEEGGVAKFVQAEDRWINVSNVDHPVIGHPDLTGTTRVSDIVEAPDGTLWMSTWRGALHFDPAIGPSSLVNLASQDVHLLNGGCRDMDIAPDGTLWFGLVGFGGATGGVLRHDPSSGDWHFWTGGNPPQGGNGWPVMVWVVRAIAVQPKPNGGYVVWADGDGGMAMVSFDSDTQLWTTYDTSLTPGTLWALPGKDPVDDEGNLFMLRIAQVVGSQITYSLDYRTPDGRWVTPPQPPTLPAQTTLRAFGDRNAIFCDDLGRVRRFDGTTWHDLGVWRAGSYNYDTGLDAEGNAWVCGVGGAARRDAATGVWQRYRVTNTSQYDFFNNDLTLDPASGRVWACANAGPGTGGMAMFDGERWTGFNNSHYGLGVSWPFPNDNSQAVGYRALTDSVAVNPTYAGMKDWDGSAWTVLGGSSESRGLLEDSLGRLWSLGNYFDLDYYVDGVWTPVPHNGTWGNNIQADLDRSGTVWVSTYYQVMRTDGTTLFSKFREELPELSTVSGVLYGVAAGRLGTAWLGSNEGLYRFDSLADTYDYFTTVDGIPCTDANPLAVTPDGRVWFSVFDSYGDGPHGLVWFDGQRAGLYPAPKTGQPQWGGLPHAQIKDLEVRVLDDRYELWMSCASRGIAVLTVPMPWADLHSGLAGSAGVPRLSGWGSLGAGAETILSLDGARPSSSAALVLGLGALLAPFKGGTLVPTPDAILTGLPVDSDGQLDLVFAWPALPAGTELFLQEWISDPAAPAGWAATNGLRATQP